MLTKQDYKVYVDSLDNADIEKLIKKLGGKKSVLRGNGDSLTLYAIDGNRYGWRAFLMYCFDTYKEKTLSLLPPTK